LIASISYTDQSQFNSESTYKSNSSIFLTKCFLDRNYFLERIFTLNHNFRPTFETTTPTIYTTITKPKKSLLHKKPILLETKHKTSEATMLGCQSYALWNIYMLRMQQYFRRTPTLQSRVTYHTLKKKLVFWKSLALQLCYIISKHMFTNKSEQNISKMSLVFYFSVGTLNIE